MQIIVDLSNFTLSSNKTAFIGSDDGELAAQMYTATINDTIHVIVPAHIGVVTPSFYRGLLGKHVELFEYRTFEELKACYTVSFIGSYSISYSNLLTTLRTWAIRPYEPPKGPTERFLAWLYGPLWRMRDKTYRK